ncbi:hypothetical protein CYMTET_31141 [Cymbomonas tetramitiformis]|uniref:Uncharacterized protein n=1 Tax=Cymbomonas tetramitiformis TaxID=36881 RepID=A0AAE0KT95_9CHLO|nr:hypothetical protein CYMTET_31141 [Cymbomonas tetramitiformis]
MPALQTATGVILVLLAVKLVTECLLPTLHLPSYMMLVAIFICLSIGGCWGFVQRGEKGNSTSNSGC